MKRSVNNIITIICFIFIVGMGIQCPYKEILICEGNECSVKRSYIIPIDDSSINYSFKRNDLVEIEYHRHVRHGGSYYLYNYKNRIFVNGFGIFSNGPDKIFNLIKSDTHKFKAIKYVFGYKIENV